MTAKVPTELKTVLIVDGTTVVEVTRAVEVMVEVMVETALGTMLRANAEEVSARALRRYAFWNCILDLIDWINL